MLEKWAGGRRVELQFVARRPAGFPEGAFLAADGGTLDVAAASADWYRPLDLPVTAAAVRNGALLVRDSFSLAYDERVVVPFRACLEPFSGWLSCRQAGAFEEHAVLAHASVMDDVRTFLGRHARGGWRELSTAAGNLPSGWTVVERVYLASTARDPPPHLSCLAPQVYTATRLDGGLPLSSGLYLTDGEPDLSLTVGPGQTSLVEIDGHQVQLQEGSIQLRLADLALGPGAHEIAASGVRRRFSSERSFGLAAPRGTATLGHIISGGHSRRPVSEIATALDATEAPPRGTVHICGAAPLAAPEDLPLEDRPPQLLPTGFDGYLALGSEAGQLVVPLPPDRPRWLGRLDLETWQFFDVPFTFPPQWLVLTGRTRIEGKVRPRVRLSGEPACMPVRHATGPITTFERLWADAIVATEASGALVDEGHTALWASYVAFANALGVQSASTTSCWRT